MEFWPGIQMIRREKFGMEGSWGEKHTPVDGDVV